MLPKYKHDCKRAALLHTAQLRGTSFQQVETACQGSTLKTASGYKVFLPPCKQTPALLLLASQLAHPLLPQARPVLQGATAPGVNALLPTVPHHLAPDSASSACTPRLYGCTHLCFSLPTTCVVPNQCPAQVHAHSALLHGSLGSARTLHAARCVLHCLPGWRACMEST